MKIVFTADWHIKLGQKNVPKDWQINRYLLLADKLAELRRSSILIIGGDIFDSVPTTEEIKLFFDMMLRISPKYHTILIYSGNHEAITKTTTFLSHFKEVLRSIADCNIIVIDDLYEWKGTGENFHIIPYNRLYSPWDFKTDAKWCFTHVRGTIEPYVKPEIDLTRFKKYKYVIAGDLHSYTNSQDIPETTTKLLYPGSPLAVSFHRSPVNNGLIILDTFSEEVRWEELGLPALYRKTVDKTEQAIPTKYDHTIYEIQGTYESLKNVDIGGIIEKKVVRKPQESIKPVLDFSSTETELRSYLKDVLQLEDKTIEDVIGVFNDKNRET